MIKFFGKIRRRLLVDLPDGKAGNKVIGYLIYAVGEIILVVIGILIAIQVDSWIEIKRNIQKEKTYLQSFYADVKSNKEEIQLNIDKADKIYRRLDTILKMEKGLFSKIDLILLSQNILFSTAYNTYNTQEGTINDILGSGNLSMITNDSIRLAVSSWNNSLRTIREQEKIDYDTGIDFANYLKNQISFYKFFDYGTSITEAEKNKLLKSTIFLNQVSERKYQKEYLVNLYKEESNRLSHLLKLIEKELNHLKND